MRKLRIKIQVSEASTPQRKISQIFSQSIIKSQSPHRAYMLRDKHLHCLPNLGHKKSNTNDCLQREIPKEKEKQKQKQRDKDRDRFERYQQRCSQGKDNRYQSLLSYRDHRGSIKEIQGIHKPVISTDRKSCQGLFNNEIIRNRLQHLNPDRINKQSHIMYPIKTEASPRNKSPRQKKRTSSIQQKCQYEQIRKKSNFHNQSLFNQKSTVFFNRSFWKNKQLNKGLQSKIKFLIMNNSVEQRTPHKKKTVNINQDQCFNDGRIVNNMLSVVQTKPISQSQL